MNSIYPHHFLEAQCRKLKGGLSLQEVDLLLMQWDVAYMKLEKAETSFEASGLMDRPEHNLRCCGCTGQTSFMNHSPWCP